MEWSGSPLSVDRRWATGGRHDGPCDGREVRSVATKKKGGAKKKSGTKKTKKKASTGRKKKK
jgi:hypothetical protein